MIRVGQKLSEERMRQRLSLSDVARATKIKEQFLLAIERGEYHKLPSPAYAQGFVRNYITYLHLPQKEMLALFRREFSDKNVSEVLPRSFTDKRVFPKVKLQQATIGIALLLIAFALYLFFSISIFISPSALTYFCSGRWENLFSRYYSFRIFRQQCDSLRE